MDLQLLWFLLLGALLTGYAVLDGFDLGVGTLHLFARGDEERRVLLNAIGPVWDGNEVWLVTFGGALFAAFPHAYACAFSALYVPFMALLFGLILRAVAIEFRSKRQAPAWRGFWDGVFCFASTLAAFLFGAAIANAVRGLPIDADGNFTGSTLDLLSPVALLGGAVSVSLFALHGAVYLLLKTDGALHQRVRRWVWITWGIFLGAYSVVTIVAAITLPRATENLRRFPWGWALVVLNLLAVAYIPRAVSTRRYLRAFLASSLSIVCLVALFGLAQFPNLVTSTLSPEYSLTLRNASSSEKTLAIMSIVAAIGMPFVLSYTAIIYWVFRGKTRVDKHSY